MNVLIVEDDPNRYAVFDRVFEGWQISKAVTAVHGCDLVRRGTFDVIMLDHDLMPGYRETSRSLKTGQDVARAIACATYDPLVVVHSWNDDGGRAICDILSNAGVRHRRIWFDPSIAVDLRALGLPVTSGMLAVDAGNNDV